MDGGLEEYRAQAEVDRDRSSDAEAFEPGPSETETIQIVVSCDDCYARHLSVMLLSLFEHSISRPVHVHVLVAEGFCSRASLELGLGHAAPSLTFYLVPESVCTNLRLRPDVTSATYFRMLMADFLPSDLQRVIFIDCDTLVQGDLSELWTIPLGQHIVGAVPDPGYEYDGVLGLQAYEPYFNSGVMLIDLWRWRNEQVGRRAFAFAEAHPERLVHMDQCALNWVLRDGWMALSPRWNLQCHALGEYVDKRFTYFIPIPRTLLQARIVHFNAPGRPWLYEDEHPCKPRYLALQAKTPWASVPQAGQYRSAVVRKALAHHAPALLPAFRFLTERILG